MAEKRHVGLSHLVTSNMRNFDIIYIHCMRFLNPTSHIPEIPAHDLVFQILRRRMMIAAKWLTSPASRKMFIAKSVDGQRITIKVS